MQKLRDRLALLLSRLRSWDPADPPKTTANDLAEEFDLLVEDVFRIAKSEGFDLKIAAEDYQAMMTVWERDDPSGTVGRYKIIKEIGVGGMGVVYKAHDPELNREIAIKIIRNDISDISDEDEASSKTRLLREAQAMATLSNHPNIVTVYDVGEHNGRVFIAMEFVKGRPIDKWIEENDLSWRQIVRLYLDAASGLISAHNEGLVHRDFKPDNVLVEEGSGVVKVMDFGLTKLEEAHHKDSRWTTDPFSLNVTISGRLIGTPAYMAPEQFLELSVDHRTDQFGFCVALYESLAGYRPFQASTIKDLANEVLNMNLISPPVKSDVPDWVWETLIKGMSVRPRDRWASMKDLAEALINPPPDVSSIQSGSRKILLIGMGLTAVGVITILLWPTNKPQHARQIEVPSMLDMNPPRALKKKEIVEEIARHSEEIKKCHDGADPDNTLMGHVDVIFVIDNSGQVSSAEVASSTFSDKRVGQCIVGTSMFWKFPPLGLTPSVEVKYPFIFVDDEE